MIHDSDAELASGYDASMSGKATLTIDRSSDAMNVPSAVTTNTRPARGAALVAATSFRRLRGNDGVHGAPVSSIMEPRLDALSSMMQPTSLEIMQRTSFETMNCSVAQCLEVIGEWWSMLIVRDAFLGVRRFDDFQTRLGISRNILTTRLTSLVDAGVLQKVPYQERPRAPRVPPHREGPRSVARAHGHARVGRQMGGAGRCPARGRPRRVRRGHGRSPTPAAHCGESVDHRSVHVRPGPGARPDSINAIAGNIPAST